VPAGEPEPAWDVATLFPAQGSWSERDYLELPTNRLVEFSDGLIEVLPAPTRRHQAIVAFLYESLKAFVVARNLGKVHFAPLPVHLWRGKYREPDVIFVRRENEKALEGDYLEGADLIMEVVSADDPERDWVKKREEYPRAGIPEYWIADPALGQITVLTLSGSVYAVHGDFATGDQATARLLPGFQVPVADALRGA
jgi:Uma2 family endonuclease